MSNLTDWNRFEQNDKCQRDLTDYRGDATTGNVKIVPHERLTFSFTIQIVDTLLTLQKIQNTTKSNVKPNNRPKDRKATFPRQKDGLPDT